VWDHFCDTAGVAVGRQWIDEVKAYESLVLSTRE
jgi:L-rhamnose isomerase